jgi:Ca2+-binding EF-hand superfamily protein
MSVTKAGASGTPSAGAAVSRPAGAPESPSTSAAAAAAAAAGGSVATRGLTPQQIAEYKEIFQLVDRDGGGTISKDELGDLMATLGIRASPEELDLMLAEVDSDGTR